MVPKGSQDKISRRNFLKGVGAGTGSGVLMGPGLRETEVRVDVPKKWDAEADVI